MSRGLGDVYKRQFSITRSTFTTTTPPSFPLAKILQLSRFYPSAHFLLSFSLFIRLSYSLIIFPILFLISISAVRHLPQLPFVHKFLMPPAPADFSQPRRKAGVGDAVPLRRYFSRLRHIPHRSLARALPASPAPAFLNPLCKVRVPSPSPKNFRTKN